MGKRAKEWKNVKSGRTVENQLKKQCKHRWKKVEKQVEINAKQGGKHVKK